MLIMVICKFSHIYCILKMYLSPSEKIGRQFCVWYNAVHTYNQRINIQWSVPTVSILEGPFLLCLLCIRTYLCPFAFYTFYPSFGYYDCGRGEREAFYILVSTFPCSNPIFVHAPSFCVDLAGCTEYVPDFMKSDHCTGGISCPPVVHKSNITE